MKILSIQSVSACIQCLDDGFDVDNFCDCRCLQSQLTSQLALRGSVVSAVRYSDLFRLAVDTFSCLCFSFSFWKRPFYKAFWSFSLTYLGKRLWCTQTWSRAAEGNLTRLARDIFPKTERHSFIRLTLSIRDVSACQEKNRQKSIRMAAPSV